MRFTRPAGSRWSHFRRWLHLYAARWLGFAVPPQLVSALCLGGVLLAAGASVRARVDSLERVISWSVIILAAFLLLSTVWSPQWMLWVLPLMILIARTAGDVIAIVAYGIIGYLVFPLIYDGLRGFESIPAQVGSILVYGILIRTVVVVYTRDQLNQPPPRLRRSGGASAKGEALRAKAEGLSPQT
jgi:hypothetical protein